MREQNTQRMYRANSSCMEAQLKKLLTKARCDKFQHQFFTEGFTSLVEIYDITEKELKEDIGMGRGDIKRFRKWQKKFNEKYQITEEEIKLDNEESFSLPAE